jgi:putative transposase
LSFYSQSQQIREIRQTNPEYALLNFSATQNIFRRIDQIFESFFRRVSNGGKPGYPRFKSADRFDSITFPGFCKQDGIGLHGKKLYIQNVGEIRLKLHRPIQGIIKTVTVRRSCGKWYVIFCCYISDVFILQSKIDNSVGIDMGLNVFAYLSDGTVIENPHFAVHGHDKIANRQRSIERKHKGSKNYIKAKTLVSKGYAKVRNQRKNFIHKTAHALVRTYNFIAYEELEIPNMVHNHRLAGAISDASWGQFISVLQYKAEEAGVVAIGVNPRNTSQRCSRCGNIVPKKLGVRIHNCPYCGLVLHRDLNASRNILALGLSVWAKSQEAIAISCS